MFVQFKAKTLNANKHHYSLCIASLCRWVGGQVAPSGTGSVSSDNCRLKALAGKHWDSGWHWSRLGRLGLRNWQGVKYIRLRCTPEPKTTALGDKGTCTRCTGCRVNIKMLLMLHLKQVAASKTLPRSCWCIKVIVESKTCVTCCAHRLSLSTLQGTKKLASAYSLNTHRYSPIKPCIADRTCKLQRKIMTRPSI